MLRLLRHNDGRWKLHSEVEWFAFMPLDAGGNIGVCAACFGGNIDDKVSRLKRRLLMTASVWRHIESFHIPYLVAFKRLGWEVHVGCAEAPAQAPSVDVCIELPFEKQMTAPTNFRAARILRQSIQSGHYDLIITHTSLASFFTRLAVKGMKMRPPLCNVMHGYLFDDDTPALKRRVLLSAERLTARQTDLLLVMNDWDFRLAERYRLGKRVERIPGMGVDFSRLESATRADGMSLRTELGIAEDAFVLLYAAEFSPRKSQPVLIRAMKALPGNAVLALCGKGATWEECRSLARTLGVEGRVLFPGQVSDMPAWYRMADACVSASRPEGLPFNVMEAMYAGLPVVASQVKGHVDLIEDGADGLLYEYGDTEACAKQVARLMADASLRQALSAAARVRAASYRLETVLTLQKPYRFTGMSQVFLNGMQMQ